MIATASFYDRKFRLLDYSKSKSNLNEEIYLKEIVSELNEKVKSKLPLAVIESDCDCESDEQTCSRS